MTQDQEQTSGSESERAPAFTFKTVAKQGFQLPIGALEGDALDKAFAFRPYTMAEDKAIARDIAHDPQATESAKVTAALKHTLITLGSRDLSEAKPEQVEAAVKGMFFGDVMYAYLLLRIVSVGKEVKFPYSCPFCRTPFIFTGDLNTVRVTCFDDPSRLEDVVMLPMPWRVRGIDARRVLLRPSPWGMIEGRMPTPVHYQAAIMQGAIAGIDDKSEGPFAGERIRLAPTEVDTMPKRVVNLLNDAVAIANGGPRLNVTTACPSPQCKADLDEPLNWSFDNFFG